MDAFLSRGPHGNDALVGAILSHEAFRGRAVLIEVVEQRMIGAAERLHPRAGGVEQAGAQADEGAMRRRGVYSVNAK